MTEELDPMTVLSGKQAELEGQLSKMTELMNQLAKQNAELMKSNGALVAQLNTVKQDEVPKQAQSEATDAEKAAQRDALSYAALCRQLGIPIKKEE